MSLPVPDLGPESPFIEGTTLQYAWDSVSLTSAMSCWRRYRYQIIDGLVPRNPSYAIALQFGIAFHKAMEHYHNLRTQWGHAEAVPMTVEAMTHDSHYTSLPTQEEVEAQADATPEDDDGITSRNAKVRTRYHLMRAVVWYLDHYAEDELATIRLPSGKAAAELSFRIPLPVYIAGQEMLLSGHLDRGVELNDHLYVADYKTTKSLSRQFFSMFELSHQMTGYNIAGQVIFDRPVSGIVVDGIALLVGGAKFQRSITSRTPGQIEEYLTTVQQVMDDAERCHDTGVYPMNTSACYFCEFKELCNKSPELRGSYERMLFEPQTAWNPLSNR